jgi:TorA maturation chaperone TorD
MTTATADGVGLAALWRLLSLGFAPPSPEAIAEVEALADGLAEAGSAIAMADLRDALRECGVDELGAEYHRLFGGTVVVSPYEGSYEVDPIRQGRQMADVAAFYRAFGAEAHGPAAERPDHAGCELEFLAFLDLRRLAAHEEGDHDGAELIDGIAASFLRDHAGRWLPTFFADVHEASPDKPVYRALAALGAAAVSAELERRELTCEPLPRRRDRLSIERDRFDCGQTH